MTPLDNASKVVSSAVKPPNAGKGRKKGVPNKTTALLKDAILTAATNAGGDKGIVGYLEKQAKDNPGPFIALLGKVLPLQVNLEGKLDLVPTIITNAKQE